MKDGRQGEESKAIPGLFSDPKCLTCAKKLKSGSRAIATYSSIDFIGNRKDRKQFCSWKCAEAHHS